MDVKLANEQEYQAVRWDAQSSSGFGPRRMGTLVHKIAVRNNQVTYTARDTVPRGQHASRCVAVVNKPINHVEIFLIRPATALPLRNAVGTIIVHGPDDPCPRRPYSQAAQNEGMSVFRVPSTDQSRNVLRPMQVDEIYNRIASEESFVIAPHFDATRFVRRDEALKVGVLRAIVPKPMGYEYPANRRTPGRLQVLNHGFLALCEWSSSNRNPQTCAYRVPRSGTNSGNPSLRRCSIT